MRRGLSYGIAWLVPMALGVLLASPAWACRCSPVTDPGAAYGQATVVVRAKVVRVKPVPARRGSRAQLAVTAAWKRGVPAKVTVQSLDLCAYRMRAGEEYVLFLVQDMKDLVTTRCMGNQPVNEAGETLRWLEENGARASPGRR